MEDKKLYMKVLALMAVTVVSIVSMAAILVHERGRMREIEAETGEIQEIRRDITVAQRNIITLATLGEGVISYLAISPNATSSPSPHWAKASSLTSPSIVK